MLIHGIKPCITDLDDTGRFFGTKSVHQTVTTYCLLVFWEEQVSDFKGKVRPMLLILSGLPQSDKLAKTQLEGVLIAFWEKQAQST